MTAQLSPVPVAKFFSNDGFPLAFGQLFTYAAGTTTPQATYVDSTQTTQNTNPIQLNFRGECNLWLDPTKTYKFLLQDLFGNTIPGWPVDNIAIGNANPSFNVIPTSDNLYTLGSASFSWANLYVGSNHAPVLDTVSGNIGYYARTTAEVAAAVTPVNYAYAPSPANVRRYGAVLDGSTNDRAALASAIAVAGSSSFTIIINGPMSIATSIVIPFNVTVQFIDTGAVKPATGQTITFNGPVQAPPVGIFQNALAGQGSIVFGNNKHNQSEFYFDWWGAVGDSVTDDTAAINACLVAVSSSQKLIKLVGSYLFTSSITVPANVEIIGTGPDFGTKLIVSGNTAINFTGSSIRSGIYRTTIELSACTATFAITFQGGAFNCTIEDCYLHAFGTGGNTVAVLIGQSQNITLNRCAISGTNSVGVYGVQVTTGALAAKIIACDIEICNRGVYVTGSADVDIISTYLEVCGAYCIYIDRNTGGHCVIVGGHLDVTPSGGAIGIVDGTTNVDIYSPDITLNGGSGIVTLGTNILSEVNVWGVPLANISDTNNVLAIYGVSGTYTGTLSGVSGTVTGTISYSCNGRSRTLSIPNISGTSNATTMSITGTLAILSPTTIHFGYSNVQDNGANAAGEMSINSSGTITCYKGLSRSAATFTNSGTKGVNAISFTYTME